MKQFSIEEFDQFLASVANRGVQPGLERIQQALTLLENPQNNYKTIHVAGTNGKGSSCYFMSQMLSKAGFRVGLVVSPHILDWRERIQWSDRDGRLQLISTSELCDVFSLVYDCIADTLQLTYFEWGVLLALVFFKSKEIDYAVLETGMGGRWDATNVCESVLCAITTIGLDHVKVLGDTPEKILIEKQEIIKQGSLVLFGPEDQSLKDIVVQKANSMAADLYYFRDLDRHVDELLEQLDLKLPAEIVNSYLSDNLKFAIAALWVLKQNESSLDLKALIQSTPFVPPPARMQVLRRDPFVMVDGAHNEMGLRRLKQYLSTQWHDEYDLVFGCLNDRDMLELVQLIKSPHRNIWLRFDAAERTTSGAVYEQVQRQFGGEILDFGQDGLSFIQANLQRPIVVCGSLYLCSEVLKSWDQSGGLL